LLKEEKNEYAHLSNFLKNSVVNRKRAVSINKDTLSTTSKFNNALIEKAGEEIRAKRAANLRSEI